LLLAGAFAPVAAEPPDPTCFEVGLTSSSLDRLVSRAVRLLAAAGHDPAGYRLELRQEEPPQPDRPWLEVRPLPSVIFLPTRGGEAYPLRVHPAYPCVTAWLWQPQRFTPWQREVVERARGLLAVGHAARLRVLESHDLLRIEPAQGQAGTAATTPLGSLTLRKSDLAVVGDPR